MIYLKANDQAAMRATLESAGVLVRDENDELIPAPGVQIFDRGTLYDPGPTPEDDPVPIPGHHCDAIGLTQDMLDAVAAIRVTPATPRFTLA